LREHILTEAVDRSGATVSEGEVEELGEWLKVGGKVEVEWGEEWWEAVVKKIEVTAQGKSGRVQVDYVGGDDQEAEWVDISYTKVLGWVSMRMRELEPEQPPEEKPPALAPGAAGTGRGSKDKNMGGKTLESEAARKEQKARDQARLESFRSSGPAIIMDMDD